MSLKHNKFLVIIPARCYSKSIKNKNIIDLSGKPLIEYTIIPALKLLNEKLVHIVIVSTDCEEIKKVSENLGVEVPFLRPKEISGDKARSITYVLHALDFFKKKKLFFDAVIILQPTSPLRTFEDVKNAIKIFNQNELSESLISCYREDTINDLIMYKKKDNNAIPLNPNHNKGTRRQDHESIYIRNGAIYISSVEYLEQNFKIISNEPLIYVMPKSRSINLDTEEDLKLLRKLL